MKFQQDSSPMRLSYLTLVIGIFVMSMYSCNRDLAYPAASLTELNSVIRFVHMDTAIQLNWDRALTAWEGDRRTEIEYEIQVSLDPNFDDPSQQATAILTDSIFVHLNEDQLTPLETYYARVRSRSKTNTAVSTWVHSAEFHILDEVPLINLFRPVRNHELTDRAVILRWEQNADLTHLVITSDDPDFRSELTLSATNNTDARRLIEGLNPGETYHVELFADVRSRGLLTFETKAGYIGEGVIDLTQITGRPSVLRDTLGKIAEGSTVLLRRGATYDFPERYFFDRSVTIVSAPGFTEPAKLDISSWLDIASGVTIDHLRFVDISVSGNVASSYLFNPDVTSTINELVIESCLISNLRGVMRTRGLKIGKFVINNSVLTNIGDFGIITTDTNVASTRDIEITNSTVANALRMIRRANTGVSESVTISDCTFYRSPRNGDYVVDYNGTTLIGGIRVANCIFGEASGSRFFRANGNPSVQVTESYAASDHGGNTFTGIQAYAKTTSEIFVNPSGGDFTIQEAALSQLGDPRWRP